ncbi:hypothetical protein [Microcystis phage Mel-JY34]
MLLEYLVEYWKEITYTFVLIILVWWLIKTM